MIALCEDCGKTHRPGWHITSTHPRVMSDRFLVGVPDRLARGDLDALKTGAWLGRKS